MTKWYYMEKSFDGTVIRGGRVKVKGEEKRKEYEKIGYKVVREEEVKKWRKGKQFQEKP